MKNETINIREFMIIALGTNEKLHAEIAGEHQAMMNGKEKRHQPD